jgi:hypothetical protein
MSLGDALDGWSIGCVPLFVAGEKDYEPGRAGHRKPARMEASRPAGRLQGWFLLALPALFARREFSRSDFCGSDRLNGSTHRLFLR